MASIETPAAKPDFTLAIHQDVDGFTLARDSVPLLKEPLVAGARVQLLIELTRLAKPIRDFTAILHAGAIGTSDSTLILASASRSGKSTLCAGLIAEGWRCYSDDSAPLDEKLSCWWRPVGSPAILRRGSVSIKADGESNGYRLRLWNVELQKPAHKTGPADCRLRFPPGTSTWNKIEHRIFSYIIQNTSGKPQLSPQTIVSLISARARLQF